jgi:hypothetical protein
VASCSLFARAKDDLFVSFLVVIVVIGLVLSILSCAKTYAPIDAMARASLF